MGQGTALVRDRLAQHQRGTGWDRTAPVRDTMGEDTASVQDKLAEHAEVVPTVLQAPAELPQH